MQSQPFDVLAASAAPLPLGARHCSIDRFEGEVAVLAMPQAAGKIGETFVDVPRVALPKGSKEGDVLVQYPDGSYQIDVAQTAQRRAEAKARMQAVLHKTK